MNHTFQKSDLKNTAHRHAGFRRFVLPVMFSLIWLAGCLPTPTAPTEYPTLPPLPVRPTSTKVPQPTYTPHVEPVPQFIYYVDGQNGSDDFLGTQDQPWKTIKKAVSTALAGDLIYVRGGFYSGIKNGWIFQNSGSKTAPITLTNFPGEQVIFKLSSVKQVDHEIFACNINPKQKESWNTPKADFIRIIGTDVEPRAIRPDIVSRKGIVIIGEEGEQSAGINSSDCDNWEVAGIDFIDVASAVFTFKNNYGLAEVHSTDNWYVHDNRVITYYREAGMQFNGNANLILNNEIYKNTSREDSPYGCVLINITGNRNTIRGNTLDGGGTKAYCVGLRFEWDLADNNLVEQNIIKDVHIGIDFQGGDNNLIRNNLIYRTLKAIPELGGIEIRSYGKNKKDWPCNETTGTAVSLLPANDPTHPDYKYYYTHRDCHSYGNQIVNNTIYGYETSIRIYPLPGENTVIRNNIFSGWKLAGLCYNNTFGFCLPLTSEIIESNNISKDFNFIDQTNNDFHLADRAPEIDAGYAVGTLVPNDLDNRARPQGNGIDIGAYEFQGQ